MRNVPSNTDDVIDSRSIIERIEELESAKSDLSDAVDELRTAEETGDDVIIARAQKDRDIAEMFFGEDEEEELKTLLDLQEECEGYCDWQHGETLIRDGYFEEYAQDFAEDLGYINKDVSWPYTCIDWEKAADELKQDYTRVSFGGEDYWIRS